MQSSKQKEKKEKKKEKKKRGHECSPTQAFS